MSGVIKIVFFVIVVVVVVVLALQSFVMGVMDNLLFVGRSNFNSLLLASVI